MHGQPTSSGRNRLPAAAILIALVLVMFLSILVLKPVVTNPDTFRGTLDYLDEKKENAMMISIGSTSASFIVSMIPDDAGTPIAEQLAKLSSYLLFVLSAILLERYLLTAFGLIAAWVLLPAGCLFGIFAVLARNRHSQQKLMETAVKLLILAICLVLIIPLGCLCGREIERANSQSIEAALNDARNANEIVQSIPEDQQKNIFEKVGEFFSGLWNSAREAYDWAKTILSNFLSSVAVMLVTTIAIPILIVLCYLWLIKILTRRDFSSSMLRLVNGLHGKPDSPEAPARRRNRG